MPRASRVDANLEVPGRWRRLFGAALFAFLFFRQKQNTSCPLRPFIELPERRRLRAWLGVLGLRLEIGAERLHGGRRPRARGSDAADGPNSEVSEEERYVETVGSVVPLEESFDEVPKYTHDRPHHQVECAQGQSDRAVRQGQISDVGGEKPDIECRMLGEPRGAYGANGEPGGQRCDTSREGGAHAIGANERCRQRTTKRDEDTRYCDEERQEDGKAGLCRVTQRSSVGIPSN